VLEGACARLHRCRLTGNADAGVKASGPGTCVTCDACQLTRSVREAAYVLNGATAVLRDCTLEGSKYGIRVRAAGTVAMVECDRCEFKDNKYSALVDAGSEAAFRHCMLSDRTQEQGKSAVTVHSGDLSNGYACVSGVHVGSSSRVLTSASTERRAGVAAFCEDGAGDAAAAASADVQGNDGAGLESPVWVFVQCAQNAPCGGVGRDRAA
jgi:hypothetical protein